MNATSLGTIVKKSVGWSIWLSVLMILAGFLAIAVPQAAGIAVNLLVAWLLVFSGAAHLVFAWHTRTTGGYSKRSVDKNVMRVHEMASAVRPEVMYVLKSRTKNFGTIKLNGSLMIQAGQWSRIMEIS